MSLPTTMSLPHFLGYSFTPVSVFSGILASVFVIFISRIIYLTHLSPISCFPGPPWASLSIWWQILTCRHGTVTMQLRDLHRKTGQTVLRIGPNHLSFWDPEAYKDIYIKKRFLKEGGFYSAFQVPWDAPNIFTHTDPALHGHRRKRLFPLFSRESVISLEQLFHEQLAIFVARLKLMEKSEGIDNSVNLFMAFRCLSIDVITLFAFGTCGECLKADKFEAPTLEAMDHFVEGNFLRLHIKNLVGFLERLPQFLQPSWQWGYQRMKTISQETVDTYRSVAHHDNKYPILLSRHIDTESPLTDDEIVSDTQIFIGAGGDTVGVTLSVGSWYIVRDPSVQAKLFSELQEAYPIRDDVLQAHWQDLEKLPYLSACVNESLRISTPIPGDLPRVVGAAGWDYKGVKIPPGTVVSSSATAVHFNETIFPEPHLFKPERWFGADGQGLESWLVSFGKGPRSCLGQTMAMAELYIFLAAFFRTFRVEMDNLTDPLVIMDFFTAAPKGYDVRARVKVRED